MKLKLQKKLAADVLNCSVKRVALDVDRLEEIKEAITKADIKSLAKDKLLNVKTFPASKVTACPILDPKSCAPVIPEASTLIPFKFIN